MADFNAEVFQNEYLAQGADVVDAVITVARIPANGSPSLRPKRTMSKKPASGSAGTSQMRSNMMC